MHKSEIRTKLAPIIGLMMTLSITLGFITVSKAAATTPATINYQGRLLSSADSPLSGNYTFRFSLWNSADWQASDTTGAGAIDIASPRYAGWQEAQNVTTDTYGLFNVSLGSIAALPNFASGTHTHLQVEVKQQGQPDTSYEILDPQGTTADAIDRKTIHKQAFAENADTLDNADVGTSAGDIATLGAGGAWTIPQIPGGTNADSFVIDNDDTSAGDITMTFGNALAKTLKYSQGNTWFEFNADVSFAKNEIKNVAIDNQAGAPVAPVAGQIYHNTTDGNSYIWNGAMWEDITAGAGINLDTAYNNGQSITVDGSGDLVFNLNNTEDFVIQTAGNPFAAFTDTGAFTLDNLQMDGNTITSTNANGNVLIDTNGTGKVELGADTEIHGTSVTMDSDNAGAGADIDITANQGVDNDGTLRYSATNDQWEISNNGGAFNKIISGTVAWADIASRAKSITLEAEYDSSVFQPDGGGDNKGTLEALYENAGGASKRNYYKWTGNVGAIQDMDLFISFTLPDDFVSFTATPIALDYKTNNGVIGTNKIDISLYDSNGNAVALNNAANLANAAWTTTNITFNGAPVFTAGTNITMMIKLSATNAGFAQTADITFNYNGK